jgi:hypothetical protein
MTLNSKVHKSNAPTGRALDRSVASSDWGSKLGYSRDAIGAVNRESIELMHELKARHAHRTTPIVVSGCVGPRGDGYDPGQVMSPTEAAAYHAHQIGLRCVQRTGRIRANSLLQGIIDQNCQARGRERRLTVGDVAGI